MGKHRSLSNALLTPEKMAFIKGEDHCPPETIVDSQPSVQSNAVVVPVVELTPGTSSVEPKPPQRNSSRRTQSPPSEIIPHSTPLPAGNGYLVAVTTRLQARTADALRRAYLEQKLNRREPATQQEIIEAAVQSWLRKHAFLD